MVAPNCKIISLLLHQCHFATVGHDPQVENSINRLDYDLASLALEEGSYLSSIMSDLCIYLNVPICTTFSLFVFESF